MVTGGRSASSHISLDPNSRLADAFAIYGVPRGITQYMSRKWTQTSPRGSVGNLASPMRTRSSLIRDQLQVCYSVLLFTEYCLLLAVSCSLFTCLGINQGFQQHCPGMQDRLVKRLLPTQEQLLIPDESDTMTNDAISDAAAGEGGSCEEGQSCHPAGSLAA